VSSLFAVDFPKAGGYQASRAIFWLEDADYTFVLKP
jgi:hypothetical protein